MIGMALFAILMCVNFASCSSDDDEPDFKEAIFEGKWYVSYEEWYDYKSDGTPDLSDITYFKRYEYHKGDEWTFTKKSDGTYTLKRSEEVQLEQIKKNTFRRGDDLFVIIEVVENEMKIEWRDNYYDCFDVSGNLISSEVDLDELEFGYYTLVR